MKKFITSIMVIAVLLLTSGHNLYAEKEWPRDEIVRAIKKSDYASTIQSLKKLYHFKTAEEINSGDMVTIASKIAEWNKKVQEIEDVLTKLNSIREEFNYPFNQKNEIKNDIAQVTEDIKNVAPTDLAQFNKLSDEKVRLEKELAELEKTIKDEVNPKVEPLKGTYNKLEQELFKLFKDVTKEK